MQGSRADIPADTASVFAGHAIHRSDTPAILAPGRVPLTFAALDVQQQYVCRTLTERGIGRGDTVAVLLPRGAEMAVACAVLPGAATVMPLDPNLAAEEYETLFRRGEARALITARGSDHRAKDAADRCGMLRLDLESAPDTPAGSFELHLVAEPARRTVPYRRVVDEDVAYILTTSGTTARRKLVPIRHGHIVGYAKAMEEWLRFGHGDRTLHLSPMHFSHGIKSTLMVPLLSGTSVVCPMELEVDSFFLLLEEFRPTWFGTGFTMFRKILNRVHAYKAIVRATPLRFLRSSFGRLTEDEFARLEDAFDTPLIVPLSSTETCLITCNPLPPRPRKPGTVGVPVVNEVKIVGDDGSLLDTGHSGEILVRGPLVFDGYIDDAEANASAFVDGWYRTGDAGFFDYDNYLTLVGRIKEMINRGGEKISPVEVDNVLTSHPDVADAAAFAVPHPTLGEIVGAAVVPAPRANLTQSAMLDYLEARLNAVKVPREIAFVDRIPRNETGKIQRVDLAREVAASRTVPGAAADAPAPVGDRPATPTMVMLAALWRQFLRKGDIGPDDDFFLLGGDSLIGAQLVLAVNERFRVSLPLKAVFSEAKTTKAMSAMIDSLQKTPTPARNVDLPMSAIDARITLQTRRSAHAKKGYGERPENIETAGTIFVLDRRTGFRSMKPHVRLGAMATNSYGYRSPEIPLEKPARTIRIAFLGNSVTFGSWDRVDEETWPSRAVETLRQSSTDFSWDHVNSAHPGMSVDHMTLQYQESISKFRPDIVVIMPGDKSSTLPLARRKIGYAGIPNLTTAFGRWSPTSELVEKNLVILLRQLRSLSDRGKMKIEPADLQGLSQSFASRLMTLVSEVRSSGAIAVLAIPESQLRRGQNKLRQIRVAGSKLYYQPYMTITGFLDVIDEFVRVTRDVAARTDSILIDLASLLPATRQYYEDAAHFSKAGHRIVGEHVGRVLGENPRIQALLRHRAQETERN